MTWGSDRSGIASSGVRSTAYVPAATMKTVAMRMRRTFLHAQRMMAVIVRYPYTRACVRQAPPMPLVAPVSWLLGLLWGGRREALQCGAQVALRIDQEIGTDHHLLAGPETVADFDVAIRSPPNDHSARLIAAFTTLHEHDAPRAAVEHGRIWYRHHRPGDYGRCDLDVRVHIRLKEFIGVGNFD